MFGVLGLGLGCRVLGLDFRVWGIPSECEVTSRGSRGVAMLFIFLIV